MSEPQAPELYPPPHEPVPCRWCGGPVVNTPIGFMHLDQYRSLAGWLCPEPRMHLAEPRVGVTVALELGPEPTTRSQPSGTAPAAGTAGAGSAEQPAPTAAPSRRPTPIPPRKGAHQAEAGPAEWPPSPGSCDWWENQAGSSTLE